MHWKSDKVHILYRPVVELHSRTKSYTTNFFNISLYMCTENGATSVYGFAVYTAAYRRDNATVRIPAQRAATRRN